MLAIDSEGFQVGFATRVAKIAFVIREGNYVGAGVEDFRCCADAHPEFAVDSFRWSKKKKGYEVIDACEKK